MLLIGIHLRYIVIYFFSVTTLAFMLSSTLALALSEMGVKVRSPALISASSMVRVAFLPVPMRVSAVRLAAAGKTHTKCAVLIHDLLAVVPTDDLVPLVTYVAVRLSALAQIGVTEACTHSS